MNLPEDEEEEEVEEEATGGGGWAVLFIVIGLFAAGWGDVGEGLSGYTI